MLDYAVTEIPPEKILMGMPNYGYDWTLPFMRGTAAQSVSFTQAVDLALRYGVEIQFDEQAQTPYFYYTDNGTQHVVWFDDPRSIDAKLQLIDDYRLAGASWWTVNRCYVPNWLVLQNLFTTADALTGIAETVRAPASAAASRLFILFFIKCIVLS